MIQDSIYSKKVSFEELALDWCRVNDQIADLRDEFIELYAKKIGEIGVLVFTTLLELTKEHELLNYYIDREKYSYDAIFKFVKQVQQDKNDELEKKVKILQQAA